MSTDNDEKTKEALEKLFSAGDAWLRKYGVVDTPLVHNNLVLNIRMRFPKIKELEYYFDVNSQKIHIVAHLGFWHGLFLNKARFLDEVIDFVKDYLHSWTVTVQLKRYRPSTEKKSEE